jgi:hypothetical protein
MLLDLIGSELECFCSLGEMSFILLSMLLEY